MHCTNRARWLVIAGPNASQSGTETDRTNTRQGVRLTLETPSGTIRVFESDCQPQKSEVPA